MNRPVHPLIKSRDPAPNDANRPSLIRLGTDVVALIVEVIHDTSPRTLPALSCVNSWLYSLARYSQHGSVQLHLGRRQPDKTAASAERLRSIVAAGLLPAIRTLRLTSGDKHDLAATAELCKLLPAMTGLRDLFWPARLIPEEIVAVLGSGQRPRLRLHLEYSSACKYKADQANSLTRVAGLSILSSLTVKVEYTSTAQCQGSMRDLKRVLLSCHGLRALKLDIARPRQGCVGFPVPKEYSGCGFANGERPPALEELDLVEYPFSGKHTLDGPRSGREYLTGESYEIEYWRDHFDWSRLRRLGVPSASLGLALMPKLLNLNEVSFGGDDLMGIALFLKEVPAALQSITLQYLHPEILEGLSKHGSSLRKLTVHHVEHAHHDWSAEATTAEELCILRESCPHLEELAVDLPRYDDWPYEALSALASFPALRHLEVWFELGIQSSDGYRRPSVTFQTVATLCKSLWTSAGRSHLAQFVVHAGAPKITARGLLAPSAYWVLGQRADFVCEICERDDEAAAGHYRIACPAAGLSARDDEVEAKVLEARRTVLCPKKLKVALNGPSTMRA